MVKSRGHHCGDIELAGYLANAVGPVPLVLDLRITHDRFGSSSDPSLNGHLRYPNDIDRSINEAAADKIRKYRTDCNNNPPSDVSFMSPIPSTSGRLHRYTVNLSDFYSYRLIGKLTVFLQLQEFSLRKPTVDCSTSAARHTLLSSNQNVETFSLRLQLYVFRDL